MKIVAFAVALCAVLFVSLSDERPRHHHSHVAHQIYSPECNVSMYRAGRLDVPQKL